MTTKGFDFLTKTAPNKEDFYVDASSEEMKAYWKKREKVVKKMQKSDEDLLFFVAHTAHRVHKMLKSAKNGGLFDDFSPTEQNVKIALHMKGAKKPLKGTERDIVYASFSAADAVDGKGAYRERCWKFLPRERTKKDEKLFKKMSLQSVIPMMRLEYFDSHIIDVTGEYKKDAKKVAEKFEKVEKWRDYTFSRASLLCAIGIMREFLFPYTKKRGILSKTKMHDAIGAGEIVLRSKDSSGTLRETYRRRELLMRVEVVKTQIVSWILGRSLEKAVIDSAKGWGRIIIHESTSKENRFRDIDIFFGDTTDRKGGWIPVSIKTGKTFSASSLSWYRKKNKKTQTPQLYVSMKDFKEEEGRLIAEDLQCFLGSDIDEYQEKAPMYTLEQGLDLLKMQNANIKLY